MDNFSIDSIGWDLKYTLYVEKRSDGRNFYSLYDYTKNSYSLKTYSKERMKIMLNLIGIKFSGYHFLEYMGKKMVAVDVFMNDGDIH